MIYGKTNGGGFGVYPEDKLFGLDWNKPPTIKAYKQSIDEGFLPEKINDAIYAMYDLRLRRAYNIYNNQRVSLPLPDDDDISGYNQVTKISSDMKTTYTITSEKRGTSHPHLQQESNYKGSKFYLHITDNDSKSTGVIEMTMKLPESMSKYKYNDPNSASYRAYISKDTIYIYINVGTKLFYDIGGDLIGIMNIGSSSLLLAFSHSGEQTGIVDIDVKDYKPFAVDDRYLYAYSDNIGKNIMLDSQLEIVGFTDISEDNYRLNALFEPLQKLPDKIYMENNEHAFVRVTEDNVYGTGWDAKKYDLFQTGGYTRRIYEVRLLSDGKVVILSKGQYQGTLTISDFMNYTVPDFDIRPWWVR